MTSLPHLINQLRRHSLRPQKSQDKVKDKDSDSDSDTDKQNPESSSEHLPSLLPEPLFSHSSLAPQTAQSTLPHLVELDGTEASVARYHHDTLFWNSTLEERGSEAVPEHDVLGRTPHAGRGYWVRDLPREVRTVAHNKTPHEDETPAHDSTNIDFKDKGTEQDWDDHDHDYDNDDNASLYAPPTPTPPKWPIRSDSLVAKALEAVRDRPRVGKHKGGGESPARKSRIMRGGSAPERNVVPVPVPFEFRLAPAVLESIEVAARADPLREGVLRGAYVARPSVVHGEGGGGNGRGEGEDGGGSAREEERGREEEGDSLYDYLLSSWDPNAPRPSTAELENAYGMYVEEEGTLEPGEEEKEVWVVRGPTPDISQHPAFRNDVRAHEEEEEHIDAQIPTNIQPRETASPSPPLVNGILPEPSTANPPHTQFTPPERTHSPSSVPSSLLLSPPSHPSDQITNPDLDDYLLSTNLLSPTSEHTFTTYRRTLAAQAKSIHDLQSRLTFLTSLTSYYEETLLPQAYTHWTTLSRENRTLTTSIRAVEQENALLWDLLELSRKLLNLCWERDRAVVNTVNTMRERKVSRAKCTLLERLVGKGGPGRGGEVEGRKKGARTWGRWRAESPFREDLEQLGFVCRQNLRVLAEDLDDWELGVGAVMEERDGKEEGRGKEGEGEEGEGNRGRTMERGRR